MSRDFRDGDPRVRPDGIINRNEDAGAKSIGSGGDAQSMTPITLTEVQSRVEELARRLWGHPSWVPQTEEMRQAKLKLAEFVLWVEADRNR